jgi:ADP-ribose pyrophosphatase
LAYETLTRTLLYSGRVFDVAQHQVRLPDGRAQTYDLVEHHGAVTLLPVDAAGNLLFVRQYRVGAQAALLELPAGVLHPGEDPAEGAAREIREETGFSAARLQRLGGFYMAPGYSTEYMHVFLAAGLAPDPLPQDDDEFLELVRIPAGEALGMALRGEIEDGKTLVALLLGREYLH